MGETPPVDLVIAAFIVVFVAASGARVFALLRVRGGDRRFEALVLLPTLILAFGGVLVAVLLVTKAPIVGVPVLAVALLIFGIWIRATLRLARSGRSTREKSEFAARWLGALEEPAVAYGLLTLGGSILAVVGLLIWGLSQKSPG